MEIFRSNDDKLVTQVIRQPCQLAALVTCVERALVFVYVPDAPESTVTRRNCSS